MAARLVRDSESAAGDHEVTQLSYTHPVHEISSIEEDARRRQSTNTTSAVYESSFVGEEILYAYAYSQVYQQNDIADGDNGKPLNPRVEPELSDVAQNIPGPQTEDEPLARESAPSTDQLITIQSNTKLDEEDEGSRSQSQSSGSPALATSPQVPILETHISLPSTDNNLTNALMLSLATSPGVALPEDVTTKDLEQPSSIPANAALSRFAQVPVINFDQHSNTDGLPETVDNVTSPASVTATKNVSSSVLFDAWKTPPLPSDTDLAPASNAVAESIQTMSAPECSTLVTNPEDLATDAHSLVDALSDDLNFSALPSLMTDAQYTVSAQTSPVPSFPVADSGCSDHSAAATTDPTLADDPCIDPATSGLIESASAPSDLHVETTPCPADTDLILTEPASSYKPSAFPIDFPLLLNALPASSEPTASPCTVLVDSAFTASPPPGAKDIPTPSLEAVVPSPDTCVPDNSLMVDYSEEHHVDCPTDGLKDRLASLDSPPGVTAKPEAPQMASSMTHVDCSGAVLDSEDPASGNGESNDDPTIDAEASPASWELHSELSGLHSVDSETGDVVARSDANEVSQEDLTGPLSCGPSSPRLSKSQVSRLSDHPPPAQCDAASMELINEFALGKAAIEQEPLGGIDEPMDESLPSSSPPDSSQPRASSPDRIFSSSPPRFTFDSPPSSPRICDMKSYDEAGKELSLVEKGAVNAPADLQRSIGKRKADDEGPVPEQAYAKRFVSTPFCLAVQIDCSNLPTPCYRKQKIYFLYRRLRTQNVRRRPRRNDSSRNWSSPSAPHWSTSKTF